MAMVDRTSRTFTYADLEALPEDDENWYELSFGTLVVTPHPNTRHQALVSNVVLFLGSRKPPSLRVLAEAELLIRPDVVKRPDVQLADESLVGGQYVAGVPELVVEIHSPSTKVLDLTEKRLVYAQARIPAYWLVDPDDRTLTVLELRGDAYEQIAVIDAEGSFEVSVPFTMTIEGSAIFE
ncbi:MAG TPA: Uma2 family endonuclease [Acidimicrobiales bacterium]|nr:Uma2 family endonuclease [Acidimicrobiales bacterium]